MKDEKHVSVDYDSIDTLPVGEARKIVNHMEGCEDCFIELMVQVGGFPALKLIELVKRAELGYEGKCPSGPEIMGYASAAMSTPELVNLAGHFGHCEPCYTNLTSMKRFVDAYVSDLAEKVMERAMKKIRLSEVE